MSFVHTLRVRYAECDAQGYVFNANHFAFFDVAMTEFWRDRFGSYQAFVDSGTDMVVRDAQATFHSPARFDDMIDLEVAVERIGTTSMVLSIAERRDGTLLVDGRMTYVYIDPATGAKKEIPADVRERLSEAPSAAPRPA